MAGYDWLAGMSNNAVEAYCEGEAPLSKWTKTRFASAMLANGIDFDAEAFFKALKEKGARPFLVREGWHHTSKFYNCTDFFSCDCDGIVSEFSAVADNDGLVFCRAILENSAKRKEKIAQKKAEKEAFEKKKEDAMKKRILTLWRHGHLNGFKQSRSGKTISGEYAGKSWFIFV